MSPKRPITQRKARGTAVSVPVEWGPADHIQTVYANQLLISHAGSEFYLIFGELVPPAVTKDGQFPDKVDIKPVAKIAVSPDAMLRFEEAIATNVQRFKERKEG